jgi:hypothetical protein
MSITARIRQVGEHSGNASQMNSAVLVSKLGRITRYPIKSFRFVIFLSPSKGRL